MTGEQYRVWQGALRLGRTYGLGPSWTVVQSTGTGIGARTVSVAGQARGYVLRNNRDHGKASLPAIPIFTAEWVFILISGSIIADQALTNDTYAFLIVGQPSADQGWTLAPLAPCALPGIGTAPIAHLRQGLRIGAV